MRTAPLPRAIALFSALLNGIVGVSLTVAGDYAGAATGLPTKEAGSRAAVDSLKVKLDQGDLWGEPLAAKTFSQVPLTKPDAVRARELIWRCHARRIAKEREAEIDKGVLQDSKHSMPIYLTTFGKEPKDGWSLWISMHGGGNAPTRVNDQQWENQKHLYKLDEGIYVAPRRRPTHGTSGTSRTSICYSIA